MQYNHQNRGKSTVFVLLLPLFWALTYTPKTQDGALGYLLLDFQAV